jgi:hypothetical protein
MDHSMKTNDTIEQIARRTWQNLIAESYSDVSKAQAHALRYQLSRHDCEALAVAFRAALFDQAFPERSKAA